MRTEDIPTISSVKQKQARYARDAFRWDAVMAGVAVGMAVQLLLVVLGLMVGLSVGRGLQQTSGVVVLPVAVSVWQSFCMLIAVFVGSYVTARCGDLRRKADGILHGIVVWAMTTLLLACFACSPVSMFLGGVFHLAPQLVSEAKLLDTPPRADMVAGQLETMLKSTTASMALKPPTPLAAKEWQLQIESGEREVAIAYLVRVLGYPNMRATLLVDQALILSGNPERASSEVRQSAAQAIDALSRSCYTILGAVLGALLAALLGGVAGAVDDRSPGTSRPH